MTTAEHIRSIQIRIETIAETETHPGETGVTLEETLAALTEPGRRRVKMLLDHIHAASHDPQERKAADLIRRRAARAWYGEGVSLVGGSGVGLVRSSAREGKQDSSDWPGVLDPDTNLRSRLVLVPVSEEDQPARIIPVSGVDPCRSLILGRRARATRS